MSIDNGSNQDSLSKFPIPDIAIQCSENWDDVEVSTYNPEFYCKTMPVMAFKIGVKPSERKYYRSEERARWRNITSGPAPSAAATPLPSSGHSRLPQSRIFVPHDVRKDVFQEEEPSQRKENAAVRSSSHAADADEQGFVIQKYSRGRRRGRIMKN